MFIQNDTSHMWLAVTTRALVMGLTEDEAEEVWREWWNGGDRAIYGSGYVAAGIIDSFIRRKEEDVHRN